MGGGALLDRPYMVLVLCGPSGLMTYAISCPLWSSVYECQKMECVFTSPLRTECEKFMM